MQGQLHAPLINEESLARIDRNWKEGKELRKQTCKNQPKTQAIKKHIKETQGTCRKRRKPNEHTVHKKTQKTLQQKRKDDRRWEKRFQPKKHLGRQEAMGRYTWSSCCTGYRNIPPCFWSGRKMKRNRLNDGPSWNHNPLYRRFVVMASVHKRRATCTSDVGMMLAYCTETAETICDNSDDSFALRFI